MYFNQAQHYHAGRKEPIRLIIIHTAESPELPNSAEAIINYFASHSSPMASCHYAIDSDSVAQGVQDSDTAFAAPGANACGIQIEHAGTANQTAIDWDDPYSQAMLELSARHVAGLCVKYDIPANRVTGSELATGKGICGHADVNDVYHQSDHYDPGTNFPWNKYINRIQEILGAQPNSLLAPLSPIGESQMNVIKTTAPWGAEVYALIGESTGARALDANEAQSYGALCGRIGETPWDYWNLLVRQAWERRNDLLAAFGKEAGISADAALAKILEQIKEAK